MWWFIALWIISAVAVYFLMPKPETAKPPEVQEVDIASVEDGKTIPVLFGTRNTESFNVVWWGDVQTRSWEDDLVIGYYYFVGVHAVLFHGPIDNISQIISDDKTAWSGECAGCEIHLPQTSADLYGGKERGGGFGGMAYGGEGIGDFEGSGYIDIDMGYPDQVRNWYLEHNLDGGDAVGDTGAHEIPAFRGVVGAILKRVYIGTSPNLRKLSFRGQRVHIRQDGVEQWYDAKSALPFYCTSGGGPNESDELNIWYTIPYYPEIYYAGGIESYKEGLYALAESLRNYKQNNDGAILNISINFYGGYKGGYVTHFRSIDDNDPLLLTDTIDDVIAFVEYFDDTNHTAWPRVNYPSIWHAPVSGEGTASFGAWHGHATPGSRLISFVGLSTVPEGDDTQDPQDGIDTLISYIDAPSFSGVENFAYSIDVVNSSDPDDATVQSLANQIDRSGTVTAPEFEDSTALGEWLSNVAYDPNYGDDIESALTQIDINPAHLIRECITDPDWGMGGAEALPDEATFMHVADTLYNESMGISIKWMNQTSIDDFIDLIKKHINAELYPDHSTGKQILKLIRDDYSVASLIILGEDDIVKVDNAKRPLIGELVNSVTVQYWDGCINKDASVTVVDQALVQMQGATINTTIQYPGFTNKRIATLAATRDLRVLSAQLLSCTIYVKRTAEELNLGSVFVLHWPDLEIDGIVMRVQGIDFGSGRQNTIKLDVVEDVFGLPATVVVSDNEDDPGWTNPIRLPVPVDYQVSVETPYYDLIQLLGQTELTAKLSNNATLGYVSAGAVRPENAINAIMATNSGGEYVDVGTLQFAGYITLLEDVDQIEKVWSYDTAIDLGLLAAGSHAEIDVEIVRIDAIDSTARTITVARGVLDTSPRKHLVGAKLLGWGSKRGFDSTEYDDNDTIKVKLKPVTGKGILDTAYAVAHPVTMDSRALRPYAPGNLEIGGAAYPTAIITGSSLAVTWAHRDRLIQGVTPHTDGDTGPEAGTTYDLTIEDDTQTVQVTYADITGVSQSVDVSGLSEGEYTLKIASKRSSVVSWDNISWVFTRSLIPIFDGIIADMNATVGVPFSLDVSSYFSTGSTPTNYSLQNNPAWMTVNNSGLITGTPTAESETSGITVTGTVASNIAVSNAFKMTSSDAVIAHAYWRIFISANDGHVDYIGFAEIEMREFIDGANVCTGGSPTASSALSGSYLASKALDGLLTTRWLTLTGNVTDEWWQYEFWGGDVSIVEVVITAPATENQSAPKDFSLQYSDNGTDWTTEASWTGESGWTSNEVRVFSV